MRLRLAASLVATLAASATSSAAAETPPDRAAVAAVAPVRPFSPAGIDVGVSSAVLLSDRSSDFGRATIFAARASYAISDYRVFGRLAVASASSFSGDSGVAFANPVLGGAMTLPSYGALESSASLSVALPVGTGGADDSTRGVRQAAQRGTALGGRPFDVDYISFSLSGDSTYRSGIASVQVRAAITPALLLRGVRETRDFSKVSLFTALRLGVSTTNTKDNALTVFAEGRVFAWITTPADVARDSTQREELYGGGGLRLAMRVNATSELVATAAYFRAADAPLANIGFSVGELDIGLTF